MYFQVDISLFIQTYAEIEANMKLFFSLSNQPLPLAGSHLKF